MLLNHFPKIRRFRLKTKVELSSLKDSEEQIESLLDSFRTHFWIVKHRWFVRLHWCPRYVNVRGLLYTLPYAFDTFIYSNANRFESTSPADVVDRKYDRVKILEHISCRKTFDDPLVVSLIQFDTVHMLTLTFSYSEQPRSILFTLNRLEVLDATVADDSGYAQRQALLDRAPRLYSLILRPLKRLRRETFNLHSRSIRRLEFTRRFTFPSRYWSRADCAVLLASSLIVQCEVLSIAVEHRADILSLLQTMSNLRALMFRLQDIDTDPLIATGVTDELMHWLHPVLSPFSTFTFVRDLYRPFSILLWISRRI